MLYTVYSLPNLILPLIGGVLLDMLGIRNGLVIFCVLITIGQAVFMFGGFHYDFNLMIIGRVIFGLGGENQQVGINSLISQWFKDKELAFAIGITMTFVRIGSVVNAATIPAIYDAHGLGFALGIGFAICMVCLVVSVGIAYLDYSSEQE